MFRSVIRARATLASSGPGSSPASARNLRSRAARIDETAGRSSSGGASSSAASSPPSTGALKSGGSLSVGATGGGAKDTIARCRPILYVENDRAAQQRILIDLIDALGYRQYWHLTPLFNPANFNGAPADVTGAAASMNMLCVPVERNLTVIDLEPIDPQNWRSPMKPIG